MATIVCPTCTTSYAVPDQFLGKSVLCKKCKTRFVVGGQQAGATGKQAAAATSSMPGGNADTAQATQAAGAPAKRASAKYLWAGGAVALLSVCCLSITCVGTIVG